MHQFSLRVYYEDTDMAGIVYYANYLKYIERARSDWVRSLGIDQNRLRTAQGLVFAVRKITADYLQPAHFDEPLQITTEMTKLTSARLYLQQNIYRARCCTVIGASGARVTIASPSPSTQTRCSRHDGMNL